MPGEPQHTESAHQDPIEAFSKSFKQSEYQTLKYAGAFVDFLSTKAQEASSVISTLSSTGSTPPQESPVIMPQRGEKGAKELISIWKNASDEGVQIPNSLDDTYKQLGELKSKTKPSSTENQTPQTQEQGAAQNELAEKLFFLEVNKFDFYLTDKKGPNQIDSQLQRINDETAEDKDNKDEDLLREERRLIQFIPQHILDKYPNIKPENYGVVKLESHRNNDVNNWFNAKKTEFDVEIASVDNRSVKTETAELASDPFAEDLDTENWSNLDKFMPWVDLVRYPDQQPSPTSEQQKNYQKNQAEARQIFINFLRSNSVNDINAFLLMYRNAHKTAVLGSNQDRPSYNGDKDPKPGEFRTGGTMVNGYYIEAKQVEAIASKYGDEFKVDSPLNKTLVLDLNDVNLNAAPKNKGYEHYYPDSKDLDEYFKQMHQAVIEYARLDPSTANLEDIVSKVSRFYQFAANARAFNQVNNSLNMNIVNAMLEKHGLKGIPHEIHDHVAHRLSEEHFTKWMMDNIKKHNPNWTRQTADVNNNPTESHLNAETKAPTPLSEIFPITEWRNSFIRTKDEIPKFVESPLIESAIKFWDLNIRTTESSANQNNLELSPPRARIQIDYDTLSDDNKAIAQQLISESDLYKIEEDYGNKFVINIPIDQSSTDISVSKQALEIAQKFQPQNADWVKPINPLELAQKYFGDDSLQELTLEHQDLLEEAGYYLDPDTMMFFPSKELFDKYKAGIPEIPSIDQDVKILVDESESGDLDIEILEDTDFPRYENTETSITVQDFEQNPEFMAAANQSQEIVDKLQDQFGDVDELDTIQRIVDVVANPYRYRTRMEVADSNYQSVINLVSPLHLDNDKLLLSLDYLSTKIIQERAKSGNTKFIDPSRRSMPRSVSRSVQGTLVPNSESMNIGRREGAENRLKAYQDRRVLQLYLNHLLRKYNPDASSEWTTTAEDGKKMLSSESLEYNLQFQTRVLMMLTGRGPNREQPNETDLAVINDTLRPAAEEFKTKSPTEAIAAYQDLITGDNHNLIISIEQWQQVLEGTDQQERKSRRQIAEDLTQRSSEGLNSVEQNIHKEFENFAHYQEHKLQIDNQLHQLNLRFQSDANTELKPEDETLLQNTPLSIIQYRCPNLPHKYAHRNLLSTNPENNTNFLSAQQIFDTWVKKEESTLVVGNAKTNKPGSVVKLKKPISINNQEYHWVVIQNDTAEASKPNDPTYQDNSVLLRTQNGDTETGIGSQSTFPKDRVSSLVYFDHAKANNQSAGREKFNPSNFDSYLGFGIKEIDNQEILTIGKPENPGTILVIKDPNKLPEEYRHLTQIVMYNRLPIDADVPENATEVRLKPFGTRLNQDGPVRFDQIGHFVIQPDKDKEPFQIDPSNVYIFNPEQASSTSSEPVDQTQENYDFLYNPGDVDFLATKGLIFNLRRANYTPPPITAADIPDTLYLKKLVEAPTAPTGTAVTTNTNNVTVTNDPILVEPNDLDIDETDEPPTPTPLITPPSSDTEPKSPPGIVLVGYDANKETQAEMARNRLGRTEQMETAIQAGKRGWRENAGTSLFNRLKNTSREVWNQQKDRLDRWADGRETRFNQFVRFGFLKNVTLERYVNQAAEEIQAVGVFTAEESIIQAREEAQQQFFSKSASERKAIREQLGIKLGNTFRLERANEAAVHQLTLEILKDKASKGLIAEVNVQKRINQTTLKRFSQDSVHWEDFIHSNAGETAIVLDESKPAEKALADGIRDIVQTYATDLNFTEADLDAKRQKLLTETLSPLLASDSDQETKDAVELFAKAEYFASTLKELGDYYRAQATHADGIATIQASIAQLEVTVGYAVPGERTSSEMLQREKTLAALEKIGVNPVTAAAAAGMLVYAIDIAAIPAHALAKWGTKKAGIAAVAAATITAPFLGAPTFAALAVGGAVAAGFTMIKARQETKGAVRQEHRRKERVGSAGLSLPPQEQRWRRLKRIVRGKSERQFLNDINVPQKSVDDLLSNIAQCYTNVEDKLTLSSASAEDITKAVSALTTAEAYKAVSDRQKGVQSGYSLITYNAKDKAELDEKRTEFDLAIHQLKQDLIRLEKIDPNSTESNADYLNNLTRLKIGVVEGTRPINDPALSEEDRAAIRGITLDELKKTYARNIHLRTLSKGARAGASAIIVGDLFLEAGHLDDTIDGIVTGSMPSDQTPLQAALSHLFPPETIEIAEVPASNVVTVLTDAQGLPETAAHLPIGSTVVDNAVGQPSDLLLPNGNRIAGAFNVSTGEVNVDVLKDHGLSVTTNEVHLVDGVAHSSTLPNGGTLNLPGQNFEYSGPQDNILTIKLSAMDLNGKPVSNGSFPIPDAFGPNGALDSQASKLLHNLGYTIQNETDSVLVASPRNPIELHNLIPETNTPPIIEGLPQNWDLFDANGDGTFDQLLFKDPQGRDITVPMREVQGKLEFVNPASAQKIFETSGIDFDPTDTDQFSHDIHATETIIENNPTSNTSGISGSTGSTINLENVDWSNTRENIWYSATAGLDPNEAATHLTVTSSGNVIISYDLDAAPIAQSSATSHPDLNIQELLAGDGARVEIGLKDGGKIIAGTLGPDQRLVLDAGSPEAEILKNGDWRYWQLVEVDPNNPEFVNPIATTTQPIIPPATPPEPIEVEVEIPKTVFNIPTQENIGATTIIGQPSLTQHIISMPKAEGAPTLSNIWPVAVYLPTATIPNQGPTTRPQNDEPEALIKPTTPGGKSPTPGGPGLPPAPGASADEPPADEFATTAADEAVEAEGAPKETRTKKAKSKADKPPATDMPPGSDAPPGSKILGDEPAAPGGKSPTPEGPGLPPAPGASADEPPADEFATTAADEAVEAEGAPKDKEPNTTKPKADKPPATEMPPGSDAPPGSEILGDEPAAPGGKSPTPEGPGLPPAPGASADEPPADEFATTAADEAVEAEGAPKETRTKKAKSKADKPPATDMPPGSDAPPGSKIPGVKPESPVAPIVPGESPTLEGSELPPAPEVPTDEPPADEFAATMQTDGAIETNESQDSSENLPYAEFVAAKLEEINGFLHSITTDEAFLILQTAPKDLVSQAVVASSTPGLLAVPQEFDHTEKHLSELASISTQKDTLRKRIRKAQEKRLMSIFDPQFPGTVEWQPLTPFEVPTHAKAVLKIPDGSTLKLDLDTSTSNQNGEINLTRDSEFLLKAHNLSIDELDTLPHEVHANPDGTRQLIIDLPDNSEVLVECYKFGGKEPAKFNDAYLRLLNVYGWDGNYPFTPEANTVWLTNSHELLPHTAVVSFTNKSDSQPVRLTLHVDIKGNPDEKSRQQLQRYQLWDPTHGYNFIENPQSIPKRIDFDTASASEISGYLNDLRNIDYSEDEITALQRLHYLLETADQHLVKLSQEAEASKKIVALSQNTLFKWFNDFNLSHHQDLVALAREHDIPLIQLVSESGEISNSPNKLTSLFIGIVLSQDMESLQSLPPELVTKITELRTRVSQEDIQRIGRRSSASHSVVVKSAAKLALQTYHQNQTMIQKRQELLSQNAPREEIIKVIDQLRKSYMRTPLEISQSERSAIEEIVNKQIVETSGSDFSLTSTLESRLNTSSVSASK